MVLRGSLVSHFARCFGDVLWFFILQVRRTLWWCVLRDSPAWLAHMISLWLARLIELYINPV